MGTKQVQSRKGQMYTLFISEKSHFSNFNPCHITAKCLDDTEQSFNCVEQYFMYNKAVFAGDLEAAIKIMKSQKPAEMKKIGRQVQGLNSAKWDAQSVDVMQRGVHAKFTQNKEHRERLFLTHGTTLAEANRSDNRWGIGLSINNPAASKEANWKGQNLLGKLLTKLRDEMWDEPEWITDRNFALEHQKMPFDFFFSPPI